MKRLRRITPDELAVIDAARLCFGHKVDTDTAEVWLDGAICTWSAPALSDAIRRLDGYPPYGHRQDLDAAAAGKRALDGYAAWKAAR